MKFKTIPDHSWQALYRQIAEEKITIISGVRVRYIEKGKHKYICEYERDYMRKMGVSRKHYE